MLPLEQLHGGHVGEILGPDRLRVSGLIAPGQADGQRLAVMHCLYVEIRVPEIAPPERADDDRALMSLCPIARRESPRAGLSWLAWR